jgi:hypothetical protein
MATLNQQPQALPEPTLVFKSTSETLIVGVDGGGATPEASLLEPIINRQGQRIEKAMPQKTLRRFRFPSITGLIHHSRRCQNLIFQRTLDEH